MVLLGSSLGGFYSTYLSQKYQLQAVLVNPAVNPQELLLDYMGKNTNYHTGEQYEFTKKHIEQLDAIYIKRIISPQKLMVILQKDDEVLDYRLAKKNILNVTCLLSPGGIIPFRTLHSIVSRSISF